MSEKIQNEQWLDTFPNKKSSRLLENIPEPLTVYVFEVQIKMTWSTLATDFSLLAARSS